MIKSKQETTFGKFMRHIMINPVVSFYQFFSAGDISVLDQQNNEISLCHRNWIHIS